MSAVKVLVQKQVCILGCFSSSSRHPWNRERCDLGIQASLTCGMCFTKKTSHSHPQEYNYEVAWQAGTSKSDKPENPDNIARRNPACHTPSALWGQPKQKRRLDTLTNASIHAFQQNVPGTPTSRGR